MAFFSESGITAAGPPPREKMRLCDKCGRSLIETPGEGWCCPKGHGCWTEGINSAQVNHSNYNADGVSLGGSAGKGKSSKGRKRKKKPKRVTWADLYGDV